MNVPLAATVPQPVRLTAEDFLLLDGAGAFARYGKTELIDGAILAVNAQHMPHAYAKGELAYRLRRALEALGSDLHVWIEASVALSAHSVPEPDVILARPDRREGLLPVGSVKLLVEISASTQKIDLGAKVRLYGQAGVPEYWVVDVDERMIHQFWLAQPDGYGERRASPFGARIEAVTIAGLAVASDELV